MGVGGGCRFRLFSAARGDDKIHGAATAALVRLFISTQLCSRCLYITIRFVFAFGELVFFFPLFFFFYDLLNVALSILSRH